jgi:hypothetical protein
LTEKRKTFSLKKKKSKWRLVGLWIWLSVAAVATFYVLAHADAKLLYRTGRSLLKLIILVGTACFIGAVFEYKAWSRFASFLALPLIRFGRLPEVSGVAFVTALFSNNAANTLVASSRSEGNITRREMLISGLCNSYPAMVSHSLRILFPLLSAIGMAAVYYYSFTFGTGLLMTIVFLVISRSYASGDATEALGNGEGCLEKRKKYNWGEVFRKSAHRTGVTVLRLLYITAPIYLVVAYMSKHHMFDVWKEFIPASMSQWLSPEVMAVLAARLGGLVNAAGVASGFLADHKMEHWQIVLAFLVGNVITNPIRTLRRNLPAAMGIFPGRDGLWIVLILQTLRLLLSIGAIIVLINTCG